MKQPLPNPSYSKSGASDRAAFAWPEKPERIDFSGT